jgi:hypothetical protein
MDAVEGHPIPQDITGFQFKLIGDMTVKQFAYLAVGLVLGWIFISVPAPLIIKLPVALVPALSGLFLAFVPVEGRPADTMFMLFVQSIFRPNQYMYHKPQEEGEKKEMVQIKQQAQLPTNDVSKKPTVSQPFGPHITKVTSIEDVGEQPVKTDVQNLSLSQAKKEEQVVEKQVTQLNQQLETAKKEEFSQPQNTQDEAHKRSLLLEQQLQQTLLEKQALEKQLAQLQQAQTAPQQVIPAQQLPQQQSSMHVKKVPDSLKKSVGMPFTPDVPNLITGVVKDARGNVLPNILVEVKDKDDNPVRAFKTNALGQFASATPLLNGTYTITFEDSKKLQKFEEFEITTNGTIINPFEVISIDEREQLRKSLFTQ